MSTHFLFSPRAYRDASALTRWHPFHLASICAQASVNTYQEDFCSLVDGHWTDEFFFKEGTSAGYCLLSDDIAIVAFAGTVSSVDWARNFELNGFQQGHFVFSYGPWQYALLSVRGFIEAVKLRDSRMLENRHVIYCGHSLGGCAAMMAPIAAEVLITDPAIKNVLTYDQLPEHYLPHSVLTFGSPACFSADTALMYPWTCWNFRHIYDLAAMWPPNRFFDRYHPGRSIFIRNAQELCYRQRGVDLGYAVLDLAIHGFSRKRVAYWHGSLTYAQSLARFLPELDWRVTSLGVLNANDQFQISPGVAGTASQPDS